MTSHVIIDGYNLLGARGWTNRSGKADLEAAREHLLRDLIGYRRRKGHPVTVVFDGWQQGSDSEHREHRAGVEVVYSRRGERADQVIQRMAEEFGRDCAVVSSDREVADFARSQGAFVIGALEFQARLNVAPDTMAGPAVSRKDPVDDDPPRRNPDKKGNPRKLPKALRKRNRLLKGF